MSGQLKIRDLEMVVALHEAGSFTQAAKRVGITEPAFSKRMQFIENHVKVKLFDRGRDGAKTTDSGRVFVAQVEDGLHNIRRGIHDAQEAKYGEGRKLHVGVSAYLPSSLIENLRSVEASFSHDLSMELVLGPSMELLTDLRQRRVDLAIVSSPPQTPIFTTIRIATSPFMIAFRKQHPLAGKRVLLLSEVADYPWAFFKRSVHPYLHDFILHRVEGEHRKARVLHYGNHPDQVISLLKDDRTIAWLNPAGTENLVDRGILFVPLLDDHIHIESHIVYLASNKSQSVTEFVRRFVKRIEQTKSPEQLALPVD